MKVDDVIYEKAELIYSNNSQTPLFSVVAEKLFKEGKNDEAKKILDEGISVYPDYATPYFIYAKILAAENEIEKAREKFEVGKKIFNNPFLEEYFEKLFAGEITEDESGKDVILQELNEEILPEKEEAENPEEEDFATETLATVYEQQGAYNEAIEVYKKLIKKFPENTSKYEEKIAELIVKQAGA